MKCKFCMEEIIDGAIKCKHCGSMQAESPRKSKSDKEVNHKCHKCGHKSKFYYPLMCAKCDIWHWKNIGIVIGGSLLIVFVIKLVFGMAVNLVTSIFTGNASPISYELNKTDMFIVNKIKEMSETEKRLKGYQFSNDMTINVKSDNFGESATCFLSLHSHSKTDRDEYTHNNWNITFASNNNKLILAFADGIGENTQEARLIVGKEEFEVPRHGDVFAIEPSSAVISAFSNTNSAEVYYGMNYGGHRISNLYGFYGFKRALAITIAVCDD